LALVHGLAAGSDARFTWLRIVTIACILAVGAAGAVRLQSAAGPPAFRAGIGAAALTVGVLGLVWYQGGPGKRGWAARAGTPSYILKRHASTSSLATATTTSTALPKSFDGQLTGRFARSSDEAGDVGLAFGAAVNGRVPAVLRLTLWGTSAGEEGVAMSDSRVSFAPAGGPGYAGKVVGLEGNQVEADLTAASGAHLRMTIVLNLDNATSSFTGSVHGNA
jgi:hypothetical protein